MVEALCLTQRDVGLVEMRLQPLLYTIKPIGQFWTHRLDFMSSTHCLHKFTGHKEIGNCYVVTTDEVRTLQQHLFYPVETTIKFQLMAPKAVAVDRNVLDLRFKNLFKNSTSTFHSDDRIANGCSTRNVGPVSLKCVNFCNERFLTFS